ncbi:MAG: ABC transporter ATP-binding protein [Bacteroidia bacterium]|nr:ABC transporter ATP-binding protein [Bacteroidia bacterium]
MYRIGAMRQPYLSLRDELTKPFRRLSSAFSQLTKDQRLRTKDQKRSSIDFWALRDVSFSINEGEAVGIIGSNGAGKSTLLKILSQITPPTEGKITCRGRIASLLEVGTGFHPELTGRENIFLNGAILGMTRTEIRKKFDEIVSFAEVEKFLDTPVKRYSSGMYVRLAFAVAAHLEPEILVVDEVLAVGDAQFQKKCLGKMGEVAKGGRTVLFVSHNMAAIQALCTKAIYLDAGKMFGFGEVDEQIGEYLGKIQTERKTYKLGPIGLGAFAQLRKFEFRPTPVISCGQCEFLVELWSERTLRIDDFCVIISSSATSRLAIIDLRSPESYFLKPLESIVISGKITSMPFVEGSYSVGLYYKIDGISNHAMDITDIDIVARLEHVSVIPYPVAARGIVHLHTSFEVEYSLI